MTKFNLATTLFCLTLALGTIVHADAGQGSQGADTKGSAIKQLPAGSISPDQIIKLINSCKLMLLNEYVHLKFDPTAVKPINSDYPKLFSQNSDCSWIAEEKVDVASKEHQLRILGYIYDKNLNMKCTDNANSILTNFRYSLISSDIPYIDYSIKQYFNYLETDLDTGEPKIKEMVSNYSIKSKVTGDRTIHFYNSTAYKFIKDGGEGTLEEQFSYPRAKYVQCLENGLANLNTEKAPKQ